MIYAVTVLPQSVKFDGVRINFCCASNCSRLSSTALPQTENMSYVQTFCGVQPEMLRLERVSSRTLLEPLSKQEYLYMLNLRLSRPWLWKVLSSEMCRRVVWQDFRDVSEERTAFIFKVEGQVKEKVGLAAPTTIYLGTTSSTLGLICFLLAIWLASLWTWKWRQCFPPKRR
jgi:hypothetical protein